GPSTALAALSTPSNPPILLAKRGGGRPAPKAPEAGRFRAHRVLTPGGLEAYILVNSARPRLRATARLRSSSPIVGSTLPRGSEAVGFDGSPGHTGGWDRLGSGLFDR